MTIMNERKAYFYCLIVAVIWGLGFIAVDEALVSFSCFDILFIRFVGSAALAWLLIIKKVKKIHMRTVKKGMMNGVLLFIAYALQTYAQTLTSVSNNAFLSASGVVMVPYLCYLVFKKKPSKRQIFSSCLCLIGIGVLTTSKMSFELGDFLAFSCAIFFAAHLVSLQYTCVLEDSQVINALQLGTCACLSIPCTLLFSKVPSAISLNSILSCIYIVVFATFLCFFLQTKAQQVASASSCSVILSTESLFAVIFSVILLKETIHMNLLIGGLMILISVILVQTSSLKNVSSEKTGYKHKAYR